MKLLLIAMSALLTAIAIVGVALWRLDDWVESDLQQRGALLLFKTEVEAFNLDGLTVAKDRLISVGTGRDGIPSLVDPPVVAAYAAEALSGDARVVGVVVNGQARAYPIAILNWHECINDKLGGIPIAVVYCPLCDSVSVVDRRLPGRDEPLEFGIAGLLLNSNLVIYDRTDNALWSQVKMEALSGPYAGEGLTHLDGWDLMTLSSWQAKHPEGTVVSNKLESQYDFHEPRLVGYFETDVLRFPVEPLDGRLRLKEPVVGIRLGDQVKAWPVAWVRSQPNGRVVETWAGGSVELAATQDDGVEVVRAPKDSRVLHTLWFAWAGFHPNGEVAK